MIGIVCSILIGQIVGIIVGFIVIMLLRKEK